MSLSLIFYVVCSRQASLPSVLYEPRLKGNKRIYIYYMVTMAEGSLLKAEQVQKMLTLEGTGANKDASCGSKR